MSLILPVKRFIAGLLILIGLLIFVSLTLSTIMGAYLICIVAGIFASYGIGVVVIKDEG